MIVTVTHPNGSEGLKPERSETGDSKGLNTQLFVGILFDCISTWNLYSDIVYLFYLAPKQNHFNLPKQDPCEQNESRQIILKSTHLER